MTVDDSANQPLILDCAHSGSACCISCLAIVTLSMPLTIQSVCIGISCLVVVFL